MCDDAAILLGTGGRTWLLIKRDLGLRRPAQEGGQYSMPPTTPAGLALSDKQEAIQPDCTGLI